MCVPGQCACTCVMHVCRGQRTIGGRPPTLPTTCLPAIEFRAWVLETRICIHRAICHSPLSLFETVSLYVVVWMGRTPNCVSPSFPSLQTFAYDPTHSFSDPWTLLSLVTIVCIYVNVTFMYISGLVFWALENQFMRSFLGKEYFSYFQISLVANSSLSSDGTQWNFLLPYYHVHWY